MEHDFIVIEDGVLGKAEDLLSPIAQYLKSAAGRASLAKSMIAPLRTRLDYAAIGRRVFMVEQMPEGAQPTYDRDIDITKDIK